MKALDVGDRMTQEEYDRALQNYLSARPFPERSSSEPRAVLTAGQPGAGKSRIRGEARREFEAEGRLPIVIDVDMFRPWHVRAKEHQKDPLTSGERSHPDASNMASDVRNRAIADRHDLIIDGTFSQGDRAVDLCRELRDKGYKVEIHVQVTHPELSRMRTYRRLEKAIEDGGYPRFIPERIQAQKCRGMRQTVDAAVNADVVDRLCLYGPEGEPMLDVRRGDERMTQAGELLRRQHGRDLKADEKEEVLAGYKYATVNAEERWKAQGLEQPRSYVRDKEMNLKRAQMALTKKPKSR